MVTENTNITYAQDSHPSRLALARLLAGDLDEAGRGELEKHIQACPACNANYANAGREAAMFSQKHPTLDSLSAGRRKAAPETALDWRKKLGGIFDRAFGLRPALAAFSLLAVVAVIWTFNARHGGDLMAKGGTHFLLAVNGREVRGYEIPSKQGDTLQLGITATTPVYYAVLYRDDNGKTVAYMGGEGAGQKPLGLPQGENLPHSLVLDGGWSTEILYCVWSEHPFTVDEAVRFVQDLPGGPTPRELHAQVFQLKNLSI
jgi:hypothetical protein